jgi:hypothetical protein
MRIVPPNRIARTYTQRLVAEPAVVFPLLCPVREADWIVGWDPLLVISATGVAEPDCIFVTPAEGADETWYITRHEPEAWFVEMLKFAPAVTACRLTIRLRPAAGGSEATITYAHTSLGPRGEVFIAAFTEQHYLEFMRDWEMRLNHYLREGIAYDAPRA